MSKTSTSGSQSRWKKAQEYEAAWWQNVTDIYETDYLEFLASDIEEKLEKNGFRLPDAAVIEVGAGPVGIVSFLRCRRRVASDPLNSLFESQPAYRAHREQARQHNVEFIEAKGEKLPYSNGEFDLLITDNVLDHTESPEKILSEAGRVLAPGGMMYLRVNVYHFWGRFIRGLMELAVIDKGHPFTFSAKKTRSHGGNPGLPDPFLKQGILFQKLEKRLVAGTFGQPEGTDPGIAVCKPRALRTDPSPSGMNRVKPGQEAAVKNKSRTLQ